jgi:tRNA-dihydrouridine synthase B
VTVSFKQYDINFPYFMAPMVGLSHVAFRQLVQEYSPDGARSLWPTEMLNSRRIPSQGIGKTPETLKSDLDTGLWPQILGNEERFIAPSLERLEAWGAEAIDINMGCPVSRALKHNYGVSLMGNPDYAAEVVRITVRNTNLPVSVKFRSGLSSHQDILKGFGQKMTQAGASWLSLHPRNGDQKRRGQAKWEEIKYLKKIVPIPVIGNGDIQHLDHVFKMQEDTGCDGVMIGRALTARPWLFWQIGQKLGFGEPDQFKETSAPETPQEEAQEYGRAVLRFIDLCDHYFEEPLALRRIRFFIRVGHCWLNYGHRLSQLSHQAKTILELRNVLQRFFNNGDLRLSKETDLRY